MDLKSETTTAVHYCTNFKHFGCSKAWSIGSGWESYSKNFKMPFFQDIKHSFNMGNSNRSKTLPNIFLSSKFLHTRARYLSTDQAMTKSFWLIQFRHVINEFWKFEVDILICVRIIVKRFKNFGLQKKVMYSPSKLCLNWGFPLVILT